MLFVFINKFVIFSIRVMIDDEMIRHYCNEDCFTIEFDVNGSDVEITLSEIPLKSEV